GLYENTIFIFTTDNGTARGAEINAKGEVTKGYNANMRGKKGWPYDGGHRVPFFIHWPAGGMTSGKDINTITSYIDVLPTISDLCKIKNSVSVDGISTIPLIHADSTRFSQRIVFTDTQRGEFLEKGK